MCRLKMNYANICVSETEVYACISLHQCDVRVKEETCKTDVNMSNESDLICTDCLISLRCYTGPFTCSCD